MEAGPGYGDAVFSDTALYRVNITAPSDQVVVASGACATQDCAGCARSQTYAAASAARCAIS